MKNVWLIHNNIPPYRVPLFAEIARRGDFDFTVVLMAPKCKHRPHWETNANSMPFKVLTMRGMNFGLSDAKSLSIPFGLLPSLFRNQPDIVICSGFGLSTLIVFVYANIFSRPYIVWSESTPITEYLRKMGRLRQWIRKLLARHAEAFIDSGTLAREYMQSLLPANSQKSFFRSYNCVDGTLFSSLDNGEGNESSQLRRILFVGRLNQNKGIPMLLDVYNDVQRQSKQSVELILVGEGPLRGMVEAFQQSHPSASVKVCGQVSYNEIAAYYRKCDMFILLSFSDCNPLVIFEALHAGVPIICSDRAGNAHDFIIPGSNGYIVNPEDKYSILRFVLDVLKWDNAKRAACARISREQVAKANYEDSAIAFIQACESLLHR